MSEIAIVTLLLGGLHAVGWVVSGKDVHYVISQIYCAAVLVMSAGVVR
jgi:hypothetical protein